ncbi:FAD dependent oxidoreductase [Desulfatibacillum aliphaticivorans]|uniref:FAD dependent oxidoreductase n=1 Tax=Desulfatibacillum aliphaticivorans TaxID=218208 RepID=B8F929_DESAL|nr:NAD(P)/FAD-dependent oxidoreductase [Desulfatibacillum aliphaticivorans]ACL02061.1 FAD dependent oxidoreductase [Desulfatibacillum aliphaticivorans]
MNPDTVVIGAGTGGLIAALKMAQEGLGVLVLEKNPEDCHGNTWLNDLDLHPFDKYDLPKPLPEELAFPVHRNMRANSSNGDATIVMENIPNYALKVSLYQKRLVRLCREAGVEFQFGATIIDFLNNGKAVTGVIVETDGAFKEISAKVTVAACGAFSPILEKIPAFCDFNFVCRPDDRVHAIQELWKIKPGPARKMVDEGILTPNEMVFYVGVPGGGSFSTFMYQLDLDQEIMALLAGCKSQNPDVLSPRELIDDFKDNRLGFCTERIYGGGRAIPMRNPLDNLVDNGIAIVGDAAFMASPANGSGTTPSMVAGAQCGWTIAKALNAGLEPTKEHLWGYNAAFQTGLGAIFAGYYVAHRVLTTFTEQEVQELVRRKLIDPRQFKNVHDARPFSVAPLQGLGLFMKALPVLGTLIGFVKHGAKIPIITRHYKNFPKTYDPEAFEEWRRRAEKILSRLDVS